MGLSVCVPELLGWVSQIINLTDLGLHYLKNSKLITVACLAQAFLNPDLETFFDQIASYQILMDLLFKNEMYDDVMQIMDIVKDKQITGSRFPRNVVVLAMAAAYKQVSYE